MGNENRWKTPDYYERRGGIGSKLHGPKARTLIN